ncbi:MAG TPA: hypothetical protein VFM96_09755 [Gaiellaceae bacterium]|nr:hypothetical protein [Gaiellaceae bacterium]
MAARPSRLVWKFEDEDEDGNEIGPLWIDTFGEEPMSPISTEELGWTTRDQAHLIAERRGCEFVSDSGLDQLDA